jgi:hypothetical protein
MWQTAFGVWSLLSLPICFVVAKIRLSEQTSKLFRRLLFIGACDYGASTGVNVGTAKTILQIFLIDREAV